MANIELDGVNKKIKVDSGDLTLDVPGDIVLDADGGDVVFADGGTNLLKVTNSSSDVVLQPQVDTKDIVFKQYDGTTVATVEDNGTFNVAANKLAINGTAITSTAAELNILDGVTSTAAELNILDGVTSTAAELNILDGVTATASELNLLDGGTSVGSSITLADSDGFVVNDGGTMKTIPASDISTYAGGGNLIKIGQVNLGSAGNLIVDDCFNTTYDNYLVVMENVRCTVDSQSLRFRFRTGGSSGSTDSASQHRYASRYFDDDGVLASNTGVDIGYFQISDDSEEAGDWKGYCGTFTFYQPYKATSSRYSGHGSFIRNDKADIVSSHNAGHYDSNVQHTGLDFFYSSGGVAAGSVVIVYAFKE